MPIFSDNRRIVVGQRVGERTDGQAGLQCRGVGQFRHERAVDEHEPAALDVADHGAGGFGARLGRGVGRARQWLRLAHQRAEVGVLPLLDAPMRQALADEQIEGGGALRGDGAVPGKPLPRVRIGVRQARSPPRS